MTKLQFALTATLAGLPACGLLAAMTWGLWQGGMLGDSAKIPILLWIIFGIAGLGAIVAAILPVAIMIWPGVYPTQAVAMAGIPGGGAAPAATPQRKTRKDEEPADEDDGLETEEEYEESSEEGEQLFDSDAMDDDFGDDFDSFDDAPKGKKR